MAPRHQVKAIEIVAQAPGLLVRQFTFAPGEATAWHHHSQVSDRMFVLAGRIDLDLDGLEPIVLRTGDRHDLPPGQRHRLINRADEDARLLLIQDGGRYDFVADP